nr:PH domain-containing protein [Eubacterium sp.]
MNYQKLSKKAKGCMLVAELILTIIVTAVILVPWNVFKDNITFISPLLVYGVVALIWIFSIATPFIRYERYRYRFTDEEIDVKEGIIGVERNIVPIERLHKIAMQSGPIDRMFGLTKVIVTTAGGDVTIRFLEVEKAEKIVERLKTRINQYARADKDAKGEAHE